MSYPYQWGAQCEELIARTELDDSVNRLLTIEPKAGRSLPLPLQKISGSMPVSAISQQQSKKCFQLQL
jgi:hypothetical protein